MTPTTQALIELPQSSDTDIRPLVEAELARIKQHDLFKDTTRMKRFLEYIVTESLEGRDSRLKGYAIGLEVFDRPDDFDPQGDTIVRVQAGQLRRRLDLYYASEGKDSIVRILVPKGRYAPVFEIRREAPEAAESSSGGTVIEFDKQQRPGIVVLTFQNLSPDDDMAYFAEGVTAEVVNALVQFRYMRIVARSASIHDNSAVSSELSSIANTYNVQFALTGNVRRAGDLIRISVNLISVETGEHVYSKIFDRRNTPENLFEVQEEIASYVAASVAAPFGAVNRYNRGMSEGDGASMNVYEAFLKYYDMNHSPTAEKAEELLREFEDITEKTPWSSSAWAIRSILNTFMVAQRMPPSMPEARLAKAIEQGTRASAIDPENALAFRALFQAYFHSGDVETAENMAQKSISLNSNDYNVLAYYAIAQAFLGNHDLSKSFYEGATELMAAPPAWFHLSPLIIAFQNRAFEHVFGIIKDVNSDTSSAIQLLNLSCAGHLGLEEYCTAFKNRVLKSDSDYFDLALRSFEFWQPNAQLRELTIEGWRKAGVDIQS